MSNANDGMVPLSDIGQTSVDSNYPKDDQNHEEAATEQPMLEQYIPDVTKQQRKTSDIKHHRRKLFSTACIYFSFISLGLIAGQAGSTFLDLQIITNTDTDKASVMFTGTSVGYLVGSIVCGLIYDRFNNSLLLFLSLVGNAIATISVPFCPLLGIMLVFRSLQGFFGGAVETAGSADCVLIWGKDVGPYMQTIHFAYAIGGVISPIISRPFLTPREQNMANTTTMNNTAYKYNVVITSKIITDENYTTVYDAVINRTYDHDMASFNIDKQTTKVYYAYIIVAIVVMLSAFPFIARYFLDNKIQSDGNKTNSTDLDRLDNTMSFIKKCLAFLLLGMFFFAYTSVQDCVSNLLMTFVVKHLNFTKSDGSLITALFWGSFASFRFFGVFIACWISPGKLLLFDYLFLILGLLGLLFGSLTKTIVVVWISVAAIGSAESTLFPTMFTWTEKNIFPVSGRVSSFFLIMASAGGMAHPITVGYLMENVSAMLFCYVMVGETIVSFLVYGGLCMLARSLKAQRREVECKLTTEDASLTS